MVEIIKGKDANDLFIKIAQALLKGHENNPRGLKTLEINDAWLTLEDPSKSIVTLPERKLNKDYLENELKWYLSGDASAVEIQKASKFWEKLTNRNGTVNSNYGKLVLKDVWAGKSQYEWCVDKLREDPNTRQALMNYNQPVHKYDGNKDFVCTISQQFVKRDGKLDSIVLMRSNDFIYGLTYDLPWFTKLQCDLAKEVNMEVGTYNHYDMSLHVYEKHFEMLEDIANAKVD